MILILCPTLGAVHCVTHSAVPLLSSFKYEQATKRFMLEKTVASQRTTISPRRDIQLVSALELSCTTSFQCGFYPGCRTRLDDTDQSVTHRRTEERGCEAQPISVLALKNQWVCTCVWKRHKGGSVKHDVHRLGSLMAGLTGFVIPSALTIRQ